MSALAFVRGAQLVVPTGPSFRQQLCSRRVRWGVGRNARATLVTEEDEKVEVKEFGARRVFSNIAPGGDDGLLRRVHVSEIGCAALVAGTMVGAGVLALPTVARDAGFVPSSASLVAVWAYMVVTGLLISEVTINTACALGRPAGVSLLSLGRITLGKAGSVVTAASYTLLHYAILTAYTAQGGAVVAELLPPLAQLPSWGPPALFAGLLGAALYALPQRAVEQANNTLVLGVIGSFAAVVAAGGAHLAVDKLLDAHWAQVLHGELLPVLFVSCVFHNVVGGISLQLEGDLRRIYRVIIGGSAAPLAMFLTYNAVVLGNSGISSNAPGATIPVAAFSLLAIITSFVGFVAGLTELATDVRISAFKETPSEIERTEQYNYLAAVVPPIAVCLVGAPDLFLRALDTAGTYGIAVLFGFLPAAMAWQTRKNGTNLVRTVPGGDALLAAVAVVPFLLVFRQFSGSV